MNNYKHNQEGLSDKEKEFLGQFFNSEVDTNSLKKSFNKNAKRDIYAEYLPDDDRIVFYGKEFTKENDIDETSILQFAMFLHEATHAWQYQNGNLNGTLNNETYEYKLKPESIFEDFGEEQQASIIQDYAAAFLHPYEMVDNHSGENNNWNPELLKKVVEDKFPNAKEMRICLEEIDKIHNLRYKAPPNLIT